MWNRLLRSRGGGGGSDAEPQGPWSACGATGAWCSGEKICR